MSTIGRLTDNQYDYLIDDKPSDGAAKRLLIDIFNYDGSPNQCIFFFVFKKSLYLKALSMSASLLCLGEKVSLMTEYLFQFLDFNK